MTTEEALMAINGTLNIQAGLTVLTRQVKCWTVSTEESGVDKTYLDAADCQALADAFGFLALNLASDSGCAGGSGE